MPDDDRFAGDEEWTDDELLHELNRLRSWIFVQRLPVEEMARMLLHERAVLRSRAEFAEKLAGLDLGRIVADTLSGVAVGVAATAAVWWLW